MFITIGNAVGVHQQHGNRTLLRNSVDLLLGKFNEFGTALTRTAPGVFIQNRGFDDIFIPNKGPVGNLIDPLLRKATAVVGQMLIATAANVDTTMVADTNVA